MIGLRLKNKNIIIDNAQSFFSKPIQGMDTIYSARKFFGVADGAYLYTNSHLNDLLSIDESSERMGHLLKRLDTSAEDAYDMFSNNDVSLSNQPIKKMSKLTQRILDSVDYNLVKQKRQTNFAFLHSKLKDSNLFDIGKVDGQVPMVYPYWVKDMQLKKKLHNSRIYCASYWPNIKNWCEQNSIEYQLFEEVVYLPIDQRYGLDEMNLIINVILNA